MRTLLIVIVALVVAGVAEAEVTFDWVTVGDPGNACETQSQGCFGAVAYAYHISKYETTNAQYTEFLNAVAATDTYELYNTAMGSGHGGITRSGAPGSYTYSTIAGRESMPVIVVSFYDALRFANWMHNGQPKGAQGATTTEDGAYTIIAESYPDGPFITRNVGARIVLTSENEWYKAAYYDAVSMSYFDYPAGTDVQTACAWPGATANTANCRYHQAEPIVGDVTNVGSYTGSPSPKGTFDQGGNVHEWSEAIMGLDRGMRGGDFYDFGFPIHLAASSRNSMPPTFEHVFIGFRVGSIPESDPIPTLSHWGVISFGMLLLTVMAWAVWRRRVT